MKRGQSHRLTLTALNAAFLGQEVRQIRPCPHLEPIGNPIQRHRRLPPDAPGKFHLAGIAFSPGRQGRR
jgi:hypothetical protein